MNQKLHEQIDLEEGFGRNERWIHADILGIDPRLKNRGEGGESEAARHFQIARDKAKALCKNLLTYWRKKSHSLGDLRSEAKLFEGCLL